MDKGKILVIDDEDIITESCHRALTPEGYEVKMAKNGVDGLKMFENEPFDLVLVDIKMPDIDGIEVLRKVKEGWPDTEVIMITEYGTVATAVSAIKLGAYDYIEKPFTPEVLLSSVKKAIGLEVEE
ncbi:MAG: response regulator [Nitrospirae bacterium]|nr:response regulator [Nitrospirota bacterium]